MLTHRLRHRITLQTQGLVQDPDTGEMVPDWTDWLADEPAEVVPLSGREFIQSAAGQASVDCRMTIRYRAGVLPTMRVVFDSQNYNIHAVLPDASNARWLTLMVERGVNDGQ